MACTPFDGVSVPPAGESSEPALDPAEPPPMGLAFSYSLWAAAIEPAVVIKPGTTVAVPEGYNVTLWYQCFNAHGSTETRQIAAAPPEQPLSAPMGGVWGLTMADHGLARWRVTCLGEGEQEIDGEVYALLP
jgi:hypothetical protein